MERMAGAADSKACPLEDWVDSVAAENMEVGTLAVASRAVAMKVAATRAPVLKVAVAEVGEVTEVVATARVG